MTEKVEFIESYIKNGTGDYKWNDNHGELIRCKDCINLLKLPLDRHGHQPYFCKNLNIYTEGLDWFCADGERKKDILSSMYGIQGGSNNGKTL